MNYAGKIPQEVKEMNWVDQDEWFIANAGPARAAWNNRRMERELHKLEEIIFSEYEAGRDEPDPVLMRRATELRALLSM